MIDHTPNFLMSKKLFMCHALYNNFDENKKKKNDKYKNVPRLTDILEFNWSFDVFQTISDL